VSDEARRCPPSERKLARLRQAGSTPANPALVAAAVLAASGGLLVAGGAVAFGWMSEWVRASLQAAGDPQTALVVAKGVAFRGALIGGGIALVALVAALAVEAAQSGRRGEATPAAPGRRSLSLGPKIDGWRLGRAALLTAVSVVAVAATMRAVLMRAPGAFDLQRPTAVFVVLARSVAAPLLIMLIGVAVLDAIYERTAWTRGAWMTRREVEEEMRETEGHPLTRQRRSVLSRRRDDA